MARIIMGDLRLSAPESLAVQQERTRLGAQLHTPLPMSSIRLHTPTMVASDEVPYVGSCDEYMDALKAALERRQVVAVVQAAGAGKSRLAYASGDTHLVVFIDGGYGGRWPQGWKSFFKHCYTWATAHRRLGDEGQRAVSEHAKLALRLFVSCYVEWVAMVLEHIHPGETRVARDDPVNIQRRAAALRCLRNQRGNNAVGDLFEQSNSRWRSCRRRAWWATRARRPRGSLTPR